MRVIPKIVYGKCFVKMGSKKPLSEANLSPSNQIVTDNPVKKTTLKRKPSECSKCSKRCVCNQSVSHSEQIHRPKTRSSKSRNEENEPRKMKIKKSDSGNIQDSSKNSQTSLKPQNERKVSEKMVSHRHVKKLGAEKNDGLSRTSEVNSAKPENEQKQSEKIVSVKHKKKEDSKKPGKSSTTSETTSVIHVGELEIPKKVSHQKKKIDDSEQTDQKDPSTETHVDNQNGDKGQKMSSHRRRKKQDPEKNDEASNIFETSINTQNENSSPRKSSHRKKNNNELERTSHTSEANSFKPDNEETGKGTKSNKKKLHDSKPEIDEASKTSETNFKTQNEEREVKKMSHRKMKKHSSDQIDNASVISDTRVQPQIEEKDPERVESRRKEKKRSLFFSDQIDDPCKIPETNLILKHEEIDGEKIVSYRKKNKRQDSQASYQTDESKHSETSLKPQDKDRRKKRRNAKRQDDALFKSFETTYPPGSGEERPKKVSHRTTKNHDDLEQTSGLSKTSETSFTNQNVKKDSWKIVSLRKKKTLDLGQIDDPLGSSEANFNLSNEGECARKTSRRKNKKLNLEQIDVLSQTSETSFRPKSQEKDLTDTVPHRKRKKFTRGQSLEQGEPFESSFSEEGSLKTKARINESLFSTSSGEKCEIQKTKKKKKSKSALTTDNTTFPDNLEKDIFLCYIMPLDPDSEDNSQDRLQDEFVNKRDLQEIISLNNEDCEDKTPVMSTFQDTYDPSLYSTEFDQISLFYADSTHTSASSTLENSSSVHSLVDPFVTCSEQTSKLNRTKKQCCYFGSDDEGCTTPKKKKIDRCCENRPPSKKIKCVKTTKKREKLSKDCKKKRKGTPPDRRGTKSRSTEVDPDLENAEPFNPDDPNKGPCKLVPGFLKRKR